MRNLVLNVEWSHYRHLVREHPCGRDEVLRAHTSLAARSLPSPCESARIPATPITYFLQFALALALLGAPTLFLQTASAQSLVAEIDTPARDAYGRPLRPPRLVIPDYIDKEALASKPAPNHGTRANSPTPSSGTQHRQQFRAVVFPVVGIRKSSNYGMRVHPILKFSKMHTGVDLAAPEGSYVRSVQSGTVVFADPYAGYGNLVVIAHGNRVTTHYGHLEKIIVKTGKRVKAGDIIATVGTTGHSTGPHLHFEVRIDGAPKNPELFLEGIGAQAEG